jgi:hypothetical protein
MAVVSRGPMGWLSIRLPAACGLALERGAGLSGSCRGVARKTSQGFECQAAVLPVLVACCGQAVASS